MKRVITYMRNIAMRRPPAVAIPMMVALFWKNDVPEFAAASGLGLGELTALIRLAFDGVWVSVPRLLGPSVVEGAVVNELGLVVTDGIMEDGVGTGDPEGSLAAPTTGAVAEFEDVFEDVIRVEAS